ncbi:LuxR C-terminal-related transcriptional regulator [Adhaeribacter rhizoryzae]|uniref:PAS domain-containing protein n=1 Tax=Adhaeribacter rhizoryzae TaxID=2607907 RepID=A0A5M6CTC8_9BACT|nr:LuxR C-terminal-related transcriptional regulator [Adhaeribacter rhizoryzae]KAA5538568.1 PAS domain-containing protein [Adhaeribacter rhizoryzae]
MKTTNILETAFAQTTTLDKLIAIWQAQPYASDTNLIDYASLRTQTTGLEMVLSHGPCLTWVLDLRTQQFVYLSENTRSLIGYEPQLFRQDGFLTLSKLLHPADKKNILELTVQLWENILALPKEKRLGYTFSRKYRIRKPDGTSVCLLEQNKITQTDSGGNITHVLGTCTDITDLINELTFEACVQGKFTKAPMRLTPENAPVAARNILSEREKEIVRLVAEGLSSKVIADQLFISFHTVNTHRKNIIGKTHSKNTSGLVQYAISNRII